MEALGINLPFLLVQIVNLLIVYTVIAKWIVAPVGGMLEKRRENIAQGMEDARVAAEARANAEEEAAKIKAEAQAEASKIVSEATERAQSAGADVKATAEAEAATAKDKALADVAAERNQMLGDLRGQVAALAISGAQKLVGEALDEKRQHALLSDFFAGVKDGSVVVLDGAAGHARGDHGSAGDPAGICLVPGAWRQDLVDAGDRHLTSATALLQPGRVRLGRSRVAAPDAQAGCRFATTPYGMM